MCLSSSPRGVSWRNAVADRSVAGRERVHRQRVPATLPGGGQAGSRRPARTGGRTWYRRRSAITPGTTRTAGFLIVSCGQRCRDCPGQLPPLGADPGPQAASCPDAVGGCMRARAMGSTVAMRRPCARQGMITRMPRWSYGDCQVVEGDAVAVGDVGGDGVVAAAQVLHERVSGGEDPR
jgi:hypothetical protein